MARQRANLMRLILSAAPYAAVCSPEIRESSKSSG